MSALTVNWRWMQHV